MLRQRKLRYFVAVCNKRFVTIVLLLWKARSYPFLASHCVPNARLRASSTSDFPFHTCVAPWLKIPRLQKKSYWNIYIYIDYIVHRMHLHCAHHIPASKYRTRYFRSRVSPLIVSVITPGTEHAIVRRQWS